MLIGKNLFIINYQKIKKQKSAKNFILDESSPSAKISTTDVCLF